MIKLKTESFPPKADPPLAEKLKTRERKIKIENLKLKTKILNQKNL